MVKNKLQMVELMVVHSRYLTIHIVNLLYKYDTLNQEKPNFFIYLLTPPQIQCIPSRGLQFFPLSHTSIWFQLQSPSKIMFTSLMTTI